MGVDVQNIVEEATRIGGRITNINTAISELEVAFGNHRGSKSLLWDSKLFEALSAERESLRHTLLALNTALAVE